MQMFFKKISLNINIFFTERNSDVFRGHSPPFFWVHGRLFGENGFVAYGLLIKKVEIFVAKLLKGKV